MKYRDLVQFEPIESVIQLLDANQSAEAQRLVASYVISDQMADRIADVLIPQIGFADDVDHKGILVVGNYGTGKSHMMSVLSAVAEDSIHVPQIRNDKVREAASAIAGKFKVHRIEISSKMSLRGIITSELETFLKSHGINFTFPAEDQVVQNKAALVDMMSRFEEKFAGQGILVVVDELLDYLRSRRDHDLVHDLSFLREIGEIAKNTRFRFVAGVQEAVFDSGRFEHMADSLRRVKDRFQQVLIDRQDISFVVAERLLRKDAAQADAIRAHLEPFARYFGNTAERIDQFVRLFPVHPDYLAVFEKIGFAENRNALTTLSGAIRGILDSEVPKDLPGIITYDSYWAEIRSNPVFKADPAVSDVIKASEVLEEKVQSSFPTAKASYKAMAVRIIHGLSISRLTTGGDIRLPIGPTSEQLRDQLSLFHPIVVEMDTEEPAADLLAIIQTTLQEVVRTVNGQFITRVPESDQYYLDVAKNVDFDAQIDKRAESLDEDDLDKAYYRAILHLMERTSDASYVTGHQIWQHEIEWVEHRAHRSGYLFFGAPNDRPTAQPDRDFYLYFIQPFNPPRFRDEEKTDEVFITLRENDDDLVRILKRFSAAGLMALLSSAGTKATYESKAEDALKDMRRWLRDKQLTAFNVSYRGKTRSLQEWSKNFSVRDRAHLRADETINFREQVNVVAGYCFSEHFAEIYPEYPTFASIVTDQSRKMMCTNAIKSLAGGGRTKDAAMILDGLKLLDGDRVDPSRSPYATALLDMLKAKGDGQVLNRQEIFSGTAAVEIFKEGKFGLEPDLVAVVLAALVHTGDIVLSVTGAKVDSTNIAKLNELGIDDVKAFKHIEAPKDVNVSVLRDIYEILGLPPGLAQAAAKGDDEAVRSLQDEVTKLTTATLTLQTGLESKISFWGHRILRDEEITDARERIEKTKAFAESLAPYNSPGKLKNLRLTAADITAHKDDIQSFFRLSVLVERIASLSPEANYLSQAELVLREDDPWVASAKKIRTETIGKIDAQMDVAELPKIRARLTTLKKEFVAHYLSLHGKARLGIQESKTKAGLISDERLKRLDQLASIPILPANELAAIREDLGNLRTCSSLLESDLSTSPRCEHCSYTPRNEQLIFNSPASALSALDQKLDVMLEAWAKKIRAELEDPVARQEGLQMVSEKQRSFVEQFADGGDLPDKLDGDFISALREALSDLLKVEISNDQLRVALLDGGSPVTVDDMKKRFEQLLAENLKGKDAAKVRFVIVNQGS